MYYLRNRTGKAAMAVKKKRYDAEEVAAVSATAAPATPAAEAPTAG
jgi:hypothetical protein